MLLYDVTMKLIRQEKIGNIFSFEQHMFPLENEHKPLLLRNTHRSYNTVCTNTCPARKCFPVY